MPLLAFALRNVLRHRRRTVLMVLSVAWGSFLLVLGAGVTGGAERRLVLGLRGALTGDLQVLDQRNPPADLTEEPLLDPVLITDAAAATQVIAGDRDVVAVTERLGATGVIFAGSRPAPVLLTGLDLERDVLVCPALRATQGTRPSAAGQILVGQEMADRLGLALGDHVTVLLPSPNGLYDGDDFEIVGTYASAGVPLAGELFAYVSLGHLQDLLGAGTAAGSLVVRLRPGSDELVVRERLAARLAAAGLRLRVVTWAELGATLQGLGRVHAVGLGVAFALVAVVIAVGVANTTLVVVFERMRDIGTMLALGAQRERVVAALMAEMGLVVAAGAALGALCGSAAAWALSLLGIPSISRAMTLALGGDRFYPALTAGQAVAGFLGVLLVGLLAALWPAVRASRTDPVQVLRFR